MRVFVGKLNTQRDRLSFIDTHKTFWNASKALHHERVLPRQHFTAASMTRQTDFDIPVNAKTGNRLAVDNEIATYQRKAGFAPH